MAAVAALALAGCLSVPDGQGADAAPGDAADRDAGGADGGGSLPAPGVLPVTAPVVAALSADLDVDGGRDLIVVGDGGHQIAILRDGPGDPTPRFLTSAREILALTAYREPDGVWLLAAVREEATAKLVVTALDPATGVPFLDCAPPDEPTIASGAAVRLGVASLSGTARLGLMTQDSSRVSLSFTTAGCPGWLEPEAVGDEPPVAVGEIASGMVQVFGDHAYFYAVGTEGPVTTPAPVSAAAVVRLEGGVSLTTFAATSAGLAVLDVEGGAIVDQGSFGAEVAMASGDLDGDEAIDLVVADGDPTGSTVRGYRSLALAGSTVSTAPCAADQAGAACELRLPEPYAFAVSDATGFVQTDVLLLDRAGGYRCLTMAGGTLAPCP